MKIIECPRDAMQGIKDFIPTDLKVKYINQLLNIGFDTIDFGSFVSPKSIPQLRDTKEVLNALDLSTTKSNLLAIIANIRGAQDACRFNQINFLGFPLSISPTFQKRNTNKTIEDSIEEVKKIKDLTALHAKELVVYLSMAFGNPYGENFHPEIVLEMVELLNTMEIKTIALSDTIGVAAPSIISSVFDNLINKYPQIEFGAHFHSTKDKWKEKIDAAYSSGCRRFDGTLKGHGGCPMAKDELVGNIDTENIINYFSLNLDNKSLNNAKYLCDLIFN